MEMWRDVVGYEGIYEVSNLGRVRTHENKTTHSIKCGQRKWKQRILKQKISRDKTCRVSLYKDKSVQTWLVHRLVAHAFIPEIEGKDYINHIDGSRLNNTVENLEWCNHKENNNHAFDTGLIPCHNVIIYDIETREIFTFRSKQKASAFLGKNHGFVSKLLKEGKSRYSRYLIKEKRAN